MEAIQTQDNNNIQSEVLMVLENMQTESTPFASQIKTLGLSLFAFIAIGVLLAALFKSISVVTLFIVVIVLFVHETGHYIGMWKFGYKNLKMFFIPFFGAAVNGYGCVSVTKESIVYLLGPIPGILIGLIIGGIYLLTNENIWFDVAKIFVTINTLNLLPLYPLDGGQFLFGVLPQRTYRLQWLLQVVFIILTIYVLFQFAPNISSGLIGFVVARSWYLYKYNKIASKLLANGIIESKMPDNSIPSEIAPEIISLVQEETKFKKPKEIAESTWAVWTRVKAQRPTAIEQVYLTLTYISALALGIGFSVAFFL